MNLKSKITRLSKNKDKIGSIDALIHEVRILKENEPILQEHLNKLIDNLKELQNKKGLEYFTQEELEQIKREITPIKYKDYFTDEEINKLTAICTPKKNKDYADGVRGEKGEKGERGDHGRDGKDGKDGKSGEDGITTILQKKVPITLKDAETIVDKVEKLPLAKRLDATKLKNLGQLFSQYSLGVVGGGTSAVGGDAYVDTTGDTMTGDLIGTDFVSTRSGTVARVRNFISSIQLTGGRELEYTRNDDNYVVSINDGTRVTTIERDSSNNILSWSIA